MPENIILMARKEDPFARVPKSLLNDSRLSWKAKGVIAYLLGKPSDWKTNVVDISARSTDGVKAIRSALNELRRFGYAKLDKIQDSSGKIIEWVWKISDSPIFSPDAPNGQVAKGDVPNRHCTKIESTKKDCTKTKETPPAESAYSPTWKPSKIGKVAQLRAIKPPEDYPSQEEFDTFVTAEDLGNILNHRPNLYREICICKWHQWSESARRWVPVRDWRAYVMALDEKIANAFRT